MRTTPRTDGAHGLGRAAPTRVTYSRGTPDLARLARTLVLLVILAFVCVDEALARTSAQGAQTGVASTTPDYSIQRTLIDDATAARGAGDYATARAIVQEVVIDLLARPAAEQNAAWRALLNASGHEAYDAQDLATARDAWKGVYEARLAALGDDHTDVHLARQNYAVALKSLGDYAAARALEETVLEGLSRTLPGDDTDLQAARLNLADTVRTLGDLARARVLEEQVLEVFSRTLPDDHPNLQAVRGNLAMTLATLGDLAGARALDQKVLEVRSKTLSADDPDLQSARLNFAASIKELGDLAGARALEEMVLEIYSRTLPADHPQMQTVRQNLAVTLKSLGDLAGARALEERVLEVRSRTLPDDHLYLQSARQNLAVTLKSQGDLAAALALFEKVLEVRSRSLPDDHDDVQKARQNVAATIKDLGDLAGARALFEKVLEVRSRTLPDDHVDLQAARGNLAGVLKELGDIADARALEENALENYERALADDHPALQIARHSLAVTTLHQAARATGATGKEGEDRERDWKRCAELTTALCMSQAAAARRALVESSAREAEQRCASLDASLSFALSVAQGYGIFEPVRELDPLVMVLSEMTRSAGFTTASVARLASRSPKYGQLRSELRRVSGELAAEAQQGTTSEALRQALTRRENIERELMSIARSAVGGAPPRVQFDVEDLARTLSDRDAIVAYRRYLRVTIPGGAGGVVAADEPPAERLVDNLCAFVLRRPREESAAPMLTVVDLGSMEPIERAVRRWRAGLGSAGVGRGVGIGVPRESRASMREDARELRRLVLDPLLAPIGDVERLVLALDDVLHLVPIDALPLDEDGRGNPTADSLVGDRWRLETRCTLVELLDQDVVSEGTQTLVALGGASFDSAPLAWEAEDTDAPVSASPNSAQVAAILRGGSWERGFSELSHTGAEVREIAVRYDELFEGHAQSIVLEQRKASRQALEALAPSTRFLHVATHGWFAPESVRSSNDPEPLDKWSGLGARQSGEERVKGMSPMLLCGLALAGANLPEDAVGRAPGLITAEELSTLDLSNCELAVLSACDTNVGERRAGQGVASLQKALQMAGARSVITSLWKVPDEATKELMLDFYRRLWVEKKPKWRALWEAKATLRNAQDERGQPKYTTRDWAAWVLTGVPD